MPIHTLTLFENAHWERETSLVSGRVVTTKKTTIPNFKFDPYLLTTMELYPKIFWRSKNEHTIYVGLGQQHPQYAQHQQHQWVMHPFEKRCKQEKKIYTPAILLTFNPTSPNFSTTIQVTHTDQQNIETLEILNIFKSSLLQYHNKIGIDDRDFDMNVQKQEETIPSWDDWKKTIDIFKQGPLDKVVLARQKKMTYTKPVAIAPIVARLFSGPSPSPSHAHAIISSPYEAFIGTSPETLFKRQGTHCMSEAIAGTIPRIQTNEAEDEINKQKLLASHKDLYEHDLVTQFIKERLSRVCATNIYTTDIHNNHALDITPTKILTLGRLHHLQTVIQATLKEGVTDNDLLELLHPTPAVGGLPSDEALAFLQTHEPFLRGPYAGVLGHIEKGKNEKSEWIVAIRSFLIQGKEIFFWAGAGIVPESHALSEWNEIEAKLESIIKLTKI